MTTAAHIVPAIVLIIAQNKEKLLFGFSYVPPSFHVAHLVHYH